MGSIVELLVEGGPIMYLLLGLLVLGGAATAVTTALGLARYRIPAVGWLVAPLLLIWGGLVGTLLGVLQAADAIAFAAPDTRGFLAHAGYAIG